MCWKCWKCHWHSLPVSFLLTVGKWGVQHTLIHNIWGNPWTPNGSKLTFEHHSQLECLCLERRGAQSWEGLITLSCWPWGMISCPAEEEGGITPGVCQSEQNPEQVHLPGAGSPGSSSCLWVMRFCPPAACEKSDYQHSMGLMKFPLLLSHDPCVPWSPLRCESCVPWTSIYYSLFLPPYGFANLRMEGVKCCGLQFQFSRRQNYSLCIFLPAMLGCSPLFCKLMNFPSAPVSSEGVGLHRSHCFVSFLSVFSAKNTWDWGSLAYFLLFSISVAAIIKPPQHLYISEILVSVQLPLQ